MTFEYSSSESTRFGLKIYRSSLDRIDEQDLLNRMTDKRADVVFLRVPTDQTPTIHRLNRIGVPYIPAGTLVLYEADLSEEIGELRNASLTLRQLGPEDESKLDSLVHTIFPNYTNHYSANPLLDARGSLDGYSEWARTFIGAQNRFAFVAAIDDDDVGFATCSIESTKGVGVLYGVLPTAEGRGVYTDIVRLTKRHLQRSGATVMEVSTQIENAAVQRAWVKEQFKLTQSLLTIHLNPLLSASVREVHEFDFTPDRTTTKAYGDVSGDRNPVHFETALARGLGFEDVFSHGLLVSGMLSRYFGMEFPGPGTVFVGYKYTFLKPLYQGHPYRMRISFPVIRSSGYHHAVATVSDGKALCLLAYFDLFRRE